MKQPDPSRMVRRLWAAMAAMILGLAGLIAVVHTAVVDVSRMNRLITADTAPGVVALHGMNADLSRLSGLLVASLDLGVDQPALRSRIADERADMSQNLEKWLALPIDPGEGELMDAAKAGLVRLDDVTERILASTPSTPLATRKALHTELEATTDDLARVLQRALEVNANLAGYANDVAERVGRRLLPAAVGIEAASAVLAAIALVAAYRVSKADAAVAQRSLLERKNAELEAFAGRVAHDVLSPLISVSLALGLAQQRLSAQEDERVHGILVRAGGALQRVRQVVSDLLAFARAAAAPPPGAETDVAPLLRSLVHELEPLAEEAGVDLQLGGTAPVRVCCAAGILSSIVTNLVQNAIRHTDKIEHRVEVRAFAAGAEVRLEVEDTGPGVAAADTERIFEPYVRATTAGTGLGLGLATVKRLAESHGGRVGVRSPARADHGALFWVTLPALSVPRAA